MKQQTKEEITGVIEGEILTAGEQIKKRLPEILVTLIALVGGVVLYCFNLASLLGLSIILFGAMWNFFTESNRFFACIMAFLMCVVTGLVAGTMKVYGIAFLHLMFYLPTQLIYYYENRKTDNSISHTKTLSDTAYIATVVCGWLMAFGLGIVLYKVGDPYYIIDAMSSTLLIVSVFMQNGKYKVFYWVRLFACAFACVMWLVIGITSSFMIDSLVFAVLFFMYVIVDMIRFIKWSKNR